MKDNETQPATTCPKCGKRLLHGPGGTGPHCFNEECVSNTVPSQTTISPDYEMAQSAAREFCKAMGDPCACGGEPDAPCRSDAVDWIKALRLAGYQIVKAAP